MPREPMDALTWDGANRPKRRTPKMRIASNAKLPATSSNFVMWSALVTSALAQ